MDENNQRKTMSVPEMRKLLGVKKTESYWLVHRNFFRTDIIDGQMRIDVDSFEKWYANQVKHKKVTGELPGEELAKTSYSFREAANLLGVHSSALYEIWRNQDLETITVDFVKRIPIDAFENWYQDQIMYQKVVNLPTISDLESNYIPIGDAAMLLGITREKLSHITRRSNLSDLFEIVVFNDKKWISKKSLQSLDKTNQKTEVIITEPKSHSSIRDIPIPDALLKILLAYRKAPNTYFLTGIGNRYIEPRTMQNRFKTIIKDANIAPANFHALRHTFATRCIELGFDIKSLSEILGHASVNITLNRYVHPSMELKQKNMDMLSDLLAVK